MVGEHNLLFVEEVRDGLTDRVIMQSLNYNETKITVQYFPGTFDNLPE